MEHGQLSLVVSSAASRLRDLTQCSPLRTALRLRYECRLWDNPDDRLFAMSLLLHAADVSNPAKPLYIQEKWAASVLAEFFAQGDLEKALGLPVSPGFDRSVTSLAASQMNFAEYVVLPLLGAIVSIFPVRAPGRKRVPDSLPQELAESAGDANSARSLISGGRHDCAPPHLRRRS